MRDDAGRQVEDQQQEDAGEEAFERHEVEHPARLRHDDADDGGEDERADRVGLGLAEDLDRQQHADEADGERRGQQVDVEAVDDGVEAERRSGT